MNTKVKSRSRLLLAFLMIVTMLFTGGAWMSFADNGGRMTVKGVEAGATVKAYKIVKQNNKGQWEPVLNGSINDVTKPTGKEIGKLATRLSELGTPVDMTVSGKDYTGTGTPGMYLVVVSKTKSTYVYNPMVVSVNFDGSGKHDGGTVDANSKFQFGPNAYAKRSEPSLDKEITGKENNPQVENDSTKHGDTLKPGDVTSFKITTDVPSYSQVYDNAKLKFEIKDTVSEGLDAPTDIKVADGNKMLVENTDYELVESGKSFTVKLKKEYLLSGDSAKKVTVTYKAKLNSNATSGFDANTNKAEIKYSNSPSTEDDKDKTTYHYTFDIDGDVAGSKNIKGEEIVKVGVDKTTGELLTKKNITESSTVTGKLAGAKFTLYKADASGHKTNTVAGTATTDANGLMKFSKLDAGKYVLVETEAPAGYVLNDKEIPVEITAKLNAVTGILESYSVKINNEFTSTYKASYDGGTTLKTVDKSGDMTLFNNYKPGLLPTTGGMGTYLFMIVGGSLIAIAVSLHLKSRRKQEQ